MAAPVCIASNIVYARPHFLNIFQCHPYGTSGDEKSMLYPGLVNISGTYCFMNSTMQVRPPRRPRSSSHLIS